MKITIEDYEFTYTVETEDGIDCDKFCEKLTHLIGAMWGHDRMVVEYTDEYARLRKSIDQLSGDDEDAE